MSDKQNERSKLASALSNVPLVLGLLSFLLLLLSVVHEIGFYAIIGREFRSLLSLSDYVAASVYWLPTVLFWLGISALWSIAAFFLAIGGYRLTKSEAINPWSTIKLPPVGIVVGVAILSFVTALLEDFGNSHIDWASVFYAVRLYMSLGLLAIALFVLFPFKPERRLGTTLFGTLGALFSATLMAWVSFNAGVNEASNAWKSGPNYQVVMSDNSTSRGEKSDAGIGNIEKRFRVLRSIDRGLLVIDLPSRQVTLLRWEKIAQISRTSGRENPPTFWCTLWPRGCQIVSP